MKKYERLERLLRINTLIRANRQNGDGASIQDTLSVSGSAEYRQLVRYCTGIGRNFAGNEIGQSLN